MYSAEPLDKEGYTEQFDQAYSCLAQQNLRKIGARASIQQADVEYLTALLNAIRHPNLD